MNVGQMISQIMKDLAQSPQKPQKPSVKGPSGPTRPTPPARVSIGNQNFGHAIYTSRGQMKLLGSFKSQFSIKESQFANLMGQKISQDMASGIGYQPQTPNKSLDFLIATMLQQNFKMIQEHLDRQKKKRYDEAAQEDNQKEKQGDENAQDLEEELEEHEQQSGDPKSEEQALNLLKKLLEHVNDAEDQEAFCTWAKDSIERTRAELEKYYDPLPENTENTFAIMEDAILALQNGVTPGYIFTRLQETIKGKGGNAGTGFQTTI